MSDEYASSGYKGSLVNDSASAPADDNFATGNYPAEGDSTSSGGYGAGQSSWSTDAQTGRTETERASTGASAGLIDQSTSGGSLDGALQDAPQGRDAASQSLNPYGESADSREDAARLLKEGASAFSDRRGEQHESGPAGSIEQGNFGV